MSISQDPRSEPKLITNNHDDIFDNKIPMQAQRRAKIKNKQGLMDRSNHLNLVYENGMEKIGFEDENTNRTPLEFRKITDKIKYKKQLAQKSVEMITTLVIGD